MRSPRSGRSSARVLSLDARAAPSLAIRDIAGALSSRLRRAQKK
jgi:hypothetical protein